MKLSVVEIVSLGLSVALTACSHDGRTRGTGFDAAVTSHDDLSVSDDDFAVQVPQQDSGPAINYDAGMTHDPTTCAEAEMSKSYIGCDYWPTVTANAVWSVFDYAVIVSNPGANTANVTVTGGGSNNVNIKQQVPSGQLVKIGLPWVTNLKGPDADGQGNTQPMTNSVFSAKGAYHLVADVPVLVYQFNALEYKAGTGKDLNGVSWSSCPAANGIPCDSYSNDASLLLPSTAMTANYVITGLPGDDIDETGIGGSVMPSGASYAVITATVDSTTVKLKLSSTADILASSDGKIAAQSQSASGATVTYMLNAGDAIELITQDGSGHDLTGTIVQGSSPVQVIVGNPCTTDPTNYVDFTTYPSAAYTCDHVEETVLPVETWGKQYVVTAPSGPNGDKPKHSVRIYGGIATANLTYSSTISGAPKSIAAGAVVKFDTNTDFVVTGDNAFVVSSEQMSAEIVDPNNSNPDGDPSLTFFSAVEQYRDKYLFLAPTDYDTNYVDIAMPTGTTLMLDGASVTQMPTVIGGGFSEVRIKLPAGAMSGAHSLTGSAPFGIQVEGYGAQTSYQYPGGLDLKVIGMPPPPIL